MLDRLLRPNATRAISAATLFQTGGEIPNRTLAGVNINQENSITIGAVYASVRLISDVISTLPVDTFIQVDNQRQQFPMPQWLIDPEPDMSVTRADHFQMLLVSLLIDGNAFVRKLRNPDTGDVVALSVVAPHRVEVVRNSVGIVEYRIDHGQRIVSDADMIHITELRKPGVLRGVSRIETLKQTLGLSKALEEFSAQFFGTGSTVSGIIETPHEMTKDQAIELKNSWEREHRGLRKAYRPGILTGGAKFVKTTVDPDEAQMLGSREFSVEEIARIFRIPPHLLQSTKPGSMSYASVEENSKQFVTYTLLPYISKIEQAYSPMLPNGAFIRFNVDGLLRANLTERFAAYSSATQAGFLSINDIHRFEDMPPVEGGDVYRVPLANVDLGAASVTELDKRVGMVMRLIQVGFEPEAAAIAVGLPPIAHTGLPTVQLQAIAQIDPESPETVYEV
ncbi:MAG TPA: phage portal protein [Pseudomonadales bacterium]|nr:phage portal protein [Pseudomonadales bacterium]